MRGDRIWAVVPAKDLADAKSRLAGVLSADERRKLAVTMLQDVLVALAAVSALAGIAVVTRDPELAGHARSIGARVIADLRHAGPNAEVTLGITRLAAAGATGIIVIPADVPMVTPAAIEEIIRSMETPPGVVLVPALADMGTNALALTPVDAIPPCFGPQSFFRHQEAALARGLAPRILRLPEIGFDLDRPEDLATLLEQPSGAKSHTFLSECGFPTRLKTRSWPSVRRVET